MTRRLQDLQPSAVWKWFLRLCRIPRPSGHEQKVTEFLLEFADERGLERLVDPAGNVLIRKPGCGAAADAEPVALQAHTDMVPEKVDGSGHDFQTDPIQPERDGDWVTARETTLGADNGIGVSCMLAFLDADDLAHPPLECLFTVDEERGLTGAAALNPGWLDSRRLINLDSEDEGRFCIGCAGGVDISVTDTLPVGVEEGRTARVTIGGLKGGHSGMEIDRGRACGVKLAARALTVLADLGASVSGLEAGTKRNAIARGARMELWIPEAKMDDAMKAVSALEKQVRDEYRGIEEGVEMSMEPVEWDLPPVPFGHTRRLADLLLALPHGVVKMSGVAEGLVETSVNLATASLSEGSLRITLSARSSIDDARDWVVRRVRALGRMAGAGVEESGAYPGWRPRADSPLLDRARRVYSETTGKEPVVETIHAGLECGILGSRYPGLDMISMGPTIRDVHIPGERVSVPSLKRFWAFLTSLLADEL
ncbi:MAG: aminoacyl-histidine dipeptidase [Candidatus Fermentibacteraceae bacterium]